MSFIKKIKRSKEKYKNIEVLNSAKAYLSSHMYGLADFCLELDGSFKMVYIDYSGDIKRIMFSDYRGMSIKYSKGKIIVSNYNNSSLKENILFQFQGVINSINKVNVYRWGKRSIHASIVQVNRGNFSNEDNIVSSDSTIMKDPTIQHHEENPQRQRKRFEDHEKITKMISMSKKKHKQKKGN